MRFFAFILTILASLPISAAESLIDDYFLAAKRFETLVAEFNQRDSMPSVKDPEAVKLLNSLADTRVLTDHFYKVSELGLLFDICGKANSVNVSYTLFNLKKHVTSSDDLQLISAKVQTVAEENSLRFQTEIAILMPFILHCAATQAPLLEEFAKTLPQDQLTETRRKGIQQMHGGTVATYQSVLLAVGDSRIEQTNRLRIVKALAGASPSMAQMLPLDIRRQLFDISQATAKRAEEPFIESLKKITDSLADTRCTSLCKL